MGKTANGKISNTTRTDRLAEALRANLRRRKSQSRERGKAGTSDQSTKDASVKNNQSEAK